MHLSSSFPRPPLHFGGPLQDRLEMQRKNGSMDKGMAHLQALLSKDSSQIFKRTQDRALEQQKYRDRATQIRASHNDQSFPFFALPTELRLAVYAELLVTNDRLLVTWRGPRKALRQQKPMYIGILRASKRCRNEGLAVLYGENIFDMEEMCNRPLSVAKPFVSRIGPTNASLIRVVIAEYSAAAEELCTLPPRTVAPAPAPPQNPAAIGVNLPRKAAAQHPTLTVSFLVNFLSAFNIDIDRLRVLAISIIPFGYDQATQDLMYVQASPLVVHNSRTRAQWLDAKNGGGLLGTLTERVCEREKGLVQANYWRDVDARIGFWWSSPFGGREWLVYRK